MKFRAAFCAPFKIEIIELSDIAGDDIIEEYNKVRLSELPRNMENKNQDEIHYYPSLEIQNKESKHGLEILAVDNPIIMSFLFFTSGPNWQNAFYNPAANRFPA